MTQSEQWPQNVWPDNRNAQPTAGDAAAGVPTPAYVAPGW